MRESGCAHFLRKETHPPHSRARLDQPHKHTRNSSDLMNSGAMRAVRDKQRRKVCANEM